jgi:hypothetical protein
MDHARSATAIEYRTRISFSPVPAHRSKSDTDDHQHQGGKTGHDHDDAKSLERSERIAGANRFL